jgi:hypothetical protein
MHFVQPMPDIWNDATAEVRDEQQTFPTLAIKRLNAHNKGVRDIELVVIIFRRRHRDGKTK